MFKKENHSLERINKQLIRHISQWLLLNQDIDSRLITTSISRIQVTPDLSLARVHIEQTKKPETLTQILNRYQHPLHQYLFRNLNIRKIPKVCFQATCASSTTILDILDEIDAL
jgi:ribosome-binding factor A